MTDRPILFSAPMIRALLAGTKTQTRRTIKLKTGETFDEKVLVGAIQEWRTVFDKVAGKHVGRESVLVRCPYGVPGDVLWVRESCWIDRNPIVGLGGRRAFFLGGEVRGEGGMRGQAPGHPDTHCAEVFRLNSSLKPTPSIHMPRWASRITLRVTDVRVERLNDISEADALAEGVEWESADPPFYYVPGIFPHSLTAVETRDGAPASYEKLWEHINGPGSWAANPWVWAVSFEVVK